MCGSAKAGWIGDDSPVNRVTPLVRTPAVALEGFDHVPGVAHHDPEEERAVSHALCFVDHGSFRAAVGGVWQTVTAKHLFVTTRGLPFACRHDDEYPEDRCLVVRLAESAVESLRGQGVPEVAGVLPLTNRRAHLRRALGESGDPARTEALAGALFATLAPARGPERPLFRADQLAWYGHRLERAKELIRARFAEPVSLSLLARECGMSLYHFARVFRELEGQPPHRYLVEVRLKAAAARLQAGATVTETCHAVGFGSLSHFVTSYRRRFGQPPGAVGRRPRCLLDSPP
jgi:AraC-like DNA-binding protein